MATAAFSGRRPPRLDLIIPALLVAALAFAPLRTLAGGLWQTEDHSFSPIILLLAAAMALIILRRKDSPPARPAAIGLVVLFAAGVGYIAGTLLDNIFVEFLSLIAIITGLTLYLGGWTTLRTYDFPLLATIFAAPLPGSLVTSITFPLKMGVSAAATSFLRTIGLPIANEGVMIDIGNYRLLVADACSGLQSMYSLLAVAIVYLFMMRVRSAWRAAALLVAAIPIVFCLNVLRVMTLALITYNLGDAAGEGFLHGAAGMLMFVLAFFALMGIDKLLELLWIRTRRSA